jgi:hypothetical protein
MPEEYRTVDKFDRMMGALTDPAAADAIARQRESLTLSIRKRIGKEAAQARKARGEQIGFTSEAARAASKAAAKARKARRKKGSGQS